MSILSKVTIGRLPRPQKVVIYAPEGFGKSTLASRFPSPIFLDLEGGTSQLDGVSRIGEEDLPNLQKVEMAIREIIKDGQWDTVVIDTVDWLEQMVIADICKAAGGLESVEDFGFGKGYVKLAERMLLTLAIFDQAIQAGMNVVLLAHMSVVRFEPPDAAGAYDRYELKLSKDRKSGKGTASLLKEWADMQLFGNWRTQIAEKGKGDAKTYKAVGGRDRKLYCTRCSAWDAKNRHGLGDEEPWDIATIQKAFANVGAPWGNSVAGVAKSTPAAPKAAPVEKTSAAGPADKQTTPERTGAQGEPAPAVSGPPHATPAPVSSPPAVSAPEDNRPAVADPIPGIDKAEKPDQELEAIIAKNVEDEVNAYLIARGKIGPDQSFRSVPADWRARILKNPAGFLAAATAGSRKGAA